MSILKGTNWICLPITIAVYLDLKFLCQNILSDLEICQLQFAPAVYFYDSIIGILHSMSLLQ